MANPRKPSKARSAKPAPSAKPAKSGGSGEPRKFGEPRPSTTQLQWTFTHKPKGNEKFQTIPNHVGQPPYRMTLDSVLAAAQMQTITQSGRLVCHIVGDCGGIKNPVPQRLVSDHMEDDFQTPDQSARPSFFYILGDIVYFYGAESEYYGQFYEPYQHYPAPIFAIPGNHDGDVDLTQPPPLPESLAAYMENFCSEEPTISPAAGNVDRHTMTQPGPYWTLETPFVRFIGIYSNVPEGGVVIPPQTYWIRDELIAAKADNIPAVLCLHHPPYSGDKFHGGSLTMKTMIEQAAAAAGNWPHAVFTAHVHNYQRFTRRVGTGANLTQVPYVVAGAGGYYNLHAMSPLLKGQAIPMTLQSEPEVTLETFMADRHGYMKLDITKQMMKGEYFTVPRPQESWQSPAQLFDSFTLDFESRRLLLQGGMVASVPGGGMNLVPQARVQRSV
jgi:acid phosphatase type 7